MEPNPLNSFVAASLLAGVDLGVLAWATQSLGARAGTAKMVLLGLAVIAKFAVLAGGLLLMSRQPWFHKSAAALGALAPFVLFVFWQSLRLRLKKSV